MTWKNTDPTDELPPGTGIVVVWPAQGALTATVAIVTGKEVMVRSVSGSFICHTKGVKWDTDWAWCLAPGFEHLEKTNG